MCIITVIIFCAPLEKSRLVHKTLENIFYDVHIHKRPHNCGNGKYNPVMWKQKPYFILALAHNEIDKQGKAHIDTPYTYDSI